MVLGLAIGLPYHTKYGGVSANAPVNIVLPHIIGVPQVDQQVVGDPGTWTGVGITYTYQWYSDGGAVPGATLLTFYPRVVDENKRITFGVIATNSFGSTERDSLPSNFVTGFPPYTNAQMLLANDVDGIAFDWIDNSCQVKDQATPANNYTGLATTKFPCDRASTGMYLDDNGIFKTALANVHRFTHNPLTFESLGLLVEKSSTCSYTWNCDFSNVAWIKNNCTVISVSGGGIPDFPDGTDPGFALKRTAPGRAYLSRALNTNAGADTALSFFAVPVNETLFIEVAGGRFTDGLARSVSLPFTNGATGNWTIVDPSGDRILSYGVTQYLNGWYRIWIRIIPQITGSFVDLFGMNNGSDITFNMQMWCIQNTGRCDPLSPILTTTVAITQALETYSIPATAYPNRVGKRTLYAAGRSLVKSSFPQIGLAEYIDTNNYVEFIAKISTNDGDSIQTVIGGTQYTFSDGTPPALGQLLKTALSVGANWNAYFNGHPSNYSGVVLNTLPVFNTLYLGQSPRSLPYSVLNGPLVQGLSVPREMSISELETLTTLPSSDVPSPSYIATYDDPANIPTGSDRTFIDCNLGTTHPSRVIALAVLSNQAISTLTIAGVQATLIDSIIYSGAQNVSIWSAPVPIGSVGDIVVSNTSGVTSARTAIAIWAVYPANAAPVYFSAISTFNIATLNDVQIVDGGYLVYVGGALNATNTYNTTWNGVDPLEENFDYIIEANSGFFGGSIVCGEDNSGGVLTATRVGANTTVALIAASFGVSA